MIATPSVKVYCTKANLADQYGISRKTLSRDVVRLVERCDRLEIPCLFTVSEWKRKRHLPPSWVVFIVSQLG